MIKFKICDLESKTSEIVPNGVIEELNRYTKIYIWVSGGMDSTALVLALKAIEHKIPDQVYLVHTDTGLRTKSSTCTLAKLKKHTSWPLLTIYPDLPILSSLTDLLIESFRALPKAREDKDKGLYNRKVFSCCKHLKHNPGRAFIKKIPKRERERYVFLSAIAPYEATRRALFLASIRKQDKFTIWNTQMHANYCYPWRDINSPYTIPNYLDAIGWGEVKHSGCRICPILILFERMRDDMAGWTRSRRFMMQHVKGLKFCTQNTLDVY